MPQAVDVNLDAEEMMLKLEKGTDAQTIEYYKLERLVRVKEKVRKLLRTVEVKAIEMHIRGVDDPIVIASNKVGDYDNIEQYLMKVAEKYDVAVESA
ncbi:hypothetical protein [Paenibacillus montanisoli]|uniref:hypothetical protein n=1 Tax=Paenibacillus montanisoli TaxID=2081970 RepID=UPI001057FA20|nr:hypothetical protein [Paenibacillus montanisoli]